MSKNFAVGERATLRHHWVRPAPSLPANRPILWTLAAVAFSVAAVGFIAVVSKATLTSARPLAAVPPPPVFAQAFEQFAKAEPPAPTLSVRPVAPMTFARPAEPAQQAGREFATTGAASADRQTLRERTANAEARDVWPKATGVTATTSNSSAPLDCLPDALRTVLRDLEARFGKVTIVATTQLQTANHSAGGARANMHADCKAVDIKTAREPKEVLAFLRSRPEVGGTASYRNNVIHFDLNAAFRTVARRAQ
jgi:uncharacterized protein YcbK (DUF882 family)